MVRAVCSRSHGQSRRSRSVSPWSSRSASERCSGSASGGAVRIRRLVAHLVRRVVLQILAHVGDPLLHLFVLTVLSQLLPDRFFHLIEGRGRALLGLRERLDDVPAVLRLDRNRDLVLAEAEGNFLELGNQLAARRRHLPALILRRGIL